MISLNVVHYKQELPYSCMAACARMVLAHHGRICTEGQLRQHLGTMPGGTIVGNLYLLQSLGYRVRIEASTLAELGASLTAGIPPLVFLETDFLGYWSSSCHHVAVLVGLDLTSVLLNNPYFDTAPQQPSLAEFQAAWMADNYFAAFIEPTP